MWSWDGQSLINAVTVQVKSALIPLSGNATLPANLCPFSGRREFARFGNDFSKSVGEAVEAAARSSVWQRPAKHLEHMLSSEQRVNQTIEASSGSKRHLRLRNKMPRF